MVTKVTPRVDPWQQKCLKHFKQHQSVDELLQMHCRFLQVSDPFRVMQILQENAAYMSVTSHLTTEESAQIWKRIYYTEHLSQDSSPDGAEEPIKGRPKGRHVSKKQSQEG
ncbi:hypothetical protein SKAU_G00208400 [Synaphobranchus kaupii]|uniref:Uncharacterized protein n=1 Tax=Synaphobranchus kaupii TaxID=118154 RepID=A0A9Q1F8E8_SYNKA|nr:hypothetical protein SKAU_G00208400 [Synaphobranchus kaupii]